MDTKRHEFRGIWLAIIVLAAAVCSTLSGLTLYALGAPLPGVVGVAGGVFIGVAGVGMNMRKFLVD